MDYKEKVEYLKSYQQMCYRLEFINSQISKVKSPGAQEIGNGPVKSINDYIDEKTSLMEKMASIEGMIAGIDDINSRYVLAYRFLQFKTLDEVAELMGYSTKQSGRYCKKGINLLKDVL